MAIQAFIESIERDRLGHLAISKNNPITLSEINLSTKSAMEAVLSGNILKSEIYISEK